MQEMNVNDTFCIQVSYRLKSAAEVASNSGSYPLENIDIIDTQLKKQQMKHSVFKEFFFPDFQ